ncbi:MAG: hypothetical protein WCF81_16520 [Roseiarcus sp.]
MLTRNDATVENALDFVEIARPLGLKPIGFKDVGADSALLRRLRTLSMRDRMSAHVCVQNCSIGDEGRNKRWV